MIKYNKIIFDKDNKVNLGFQCQFCSRIFDNLDEVEQVIVKPNKPKWRCNICKDQNRYATVDGLVLVNLNLSLTKEQIQKEWNNRIVNEYRRELWK